ncbi:MAG TPA: AI-2E family transporter [Acidobacteriota bacterium]|nr:AI-2E family transporter [Acidobacteriota bacterium]
MNKYKSIGQFAILGIVLVLFVFVIRRFLIPVTLGMIISLVFRPAYLWLKRKLNNRSHLPAALSTFIVLICVLVPLILLGIFVYKDASHLVTTLNQISNSKDQETSGILDVPVFANVYQSINRVRPITQEEFVQRTKFFVLQLANSGTRFLTALAASVPRKVLAVVFFLISFYFGLIDGPRFVNFLRANLPFSREDTKTIFHNVEKIAKAVVLGTLLAGIVQGTIIGLAYWIFGIPRPALFGFLTAIFSFIPLVGCAPTSIGGILYLLANGRIAAAIGMTIAFTMAGLSDNVVKPWVLKGKTELHPLLGLLSVLGGLMTFGASGLFFGPIITVLVITLIRIVPHRFKESREQEKQPEPVATAHP